MFSDPVELVIAYLTPLRAPVLIASRVPNPRPERFIQVRRVGGSGLEPVREQARLDVFTWGASDPAAMELALDVRTDMWALAGTDLLGVTCYQVEEFLGPRQDDDPVSGDPRTWATYSLTIRADDVIHTSPAL